MMEHHKQETPEEIVESVEHLLGAVRITIGRHDDGFWRDFPKTRAWWHAAERTLLNASKKLKRDLD